MAESLEILIGIQGAIAQCRSLAADTSSSKTAKRLIRLADEIEQRARKADRLPEPAAFELKSGSGQTRPALWAEFELLVNSMLNHSMSTDEEYRRQATECRRMAENAVNPDDKQAWLRLAESWLQLLPRQPEAQNGPKPCDEGSK